MRKSPVSAASRFLSRPPARPRARPGLLLYAAALAGCLAPAPDPEAVPRPEGSAPPAASVEAPPLPATPAEAAALDSLFAEKPIPEAPPYPDVAPGGPPALAKRAHHGECRVDFNRPEALRLIPRRAGDTFAVWPWYIQGCHNDYAWVHVREYHERQTPDHNHYHLMYERGEFCYPAGGGYGVLSGGACVAVPDPAREPRQVWSHTGSQWIRIYAYRRGDYALPFDLRFFRVLGNTPVQVWIRKAADGSWWYWPSLGAAAWNPQPWANGIDDIAIRSAAGTTGTYGLDDFVVHVPYR